MEDDLFIDFIVHRRVGIERLKYALVCKPWAAFLVERADHQTPCPAMMQLYKSRDEVRFLQAENSWIVTLPFLSNKRISCSNCGSLLLMEDWKWDSGYTLYLYDPFSDQSVPLPPQHRVLRFFPNLTFFNPPNQDSIVCGASILLDGEVSLYILRGGILSSHSFVSELEPDIVGCHPILRNNTLYFLDKKGNILCFDLESHTFVLHTDCFQNLKSQFKDRYLLLDGERLVAIFVYDSSLAVCHFSDNNKWVKIDNIGNKTFYVGQTGSFAIKSPLEDMANKIYLTKFHNGHPIHYSLANGKYECSTGSIEKLKTFTEQGCWIFPPLLQIGGLKKDQARKQIGGLRKEKTVDWRTEGGLKKD